MSLIKNVKYNTQPCGSDKKYKKLKALIYKKKYIFLIIFKGADIENLSMLLYNKEKLLVLQDILKIRKN